MFKAALSLSKSHPSLRERPRLVTPSHTEHRPYFAAPASISSKRPHCEHLRLSLRHFDDLPFLSKTRNRTLNSKIRTSPRRPHCTNSCKVSVWTFISWLFETLTARHRTTPLPRLDSSPTSLPKSYAPLLLTRHPRLQEATPRPSGPHHQ